MMSLKVLPLLLPLLALTGAAPAVEPHAAAHPPGSHTWDFSEVFSSADGTVQFMELLECCGGPGETGLPGHTISSGSHAFVVPGGALTPPTSNKRYLIATAAFAALPGAPTPDAIIPAGTLPFFFSPAGDSLTYSPWDTWTFGPIPTDGVNSLKRNGTVSPNDPTNYAGSTGSIVVGPGVPTLSTGMLVALAVALVAVGSIVVARRTRPVHAG